MKLLQTTEDWFYLLAVLVLLMAGIFLFVMSVKGGSGGGLFTGTTSTRYPLNSIEANDSVGTDVVKLIESNLKGEWCDSNDSKYTILIQRNFVSKDPNYFGGKEDFYIEFNGMKWFSGAAIGTGGTKLIVSGPRDSAEGKFKMTFEMYSSDSMTLKINDNLYGILYRCF